MEKRDVCGHARKVGPCLERRLHALNDLPLVGDVRGSHFMMCSEYVASKRTRARLPDGGNIGKRISNHSEARGLIVRPLAPLNFMSSPLVMTEAELDEMATGLAAGIKAAADDLVREGRQTGWRANQVRSWRLVPAAGTLPSWHWQLRSSRPDVRDNRF